MLVTLENYRHDCPQRLAAEAGAPSALAPDWQPKRAIVLGAGIAGLLAARVLADRFERVLVIDRDELPTQPVGRRGVPQADHVHVLLARGQRLLEQWFPGFERSLAAAGAVPVDWTADCAMMGVGGWNPRFPSGLVTYTCSRTLMEWQIRDRVRALPQVQLLSGITIEGLVGSPQGDRLRGVRLVLPGVGETTLNAELVVDATGRRSLTPHWLETLGYDAPPTNQIDARLGYASRWYRIPRAHRSQWKSLLIWAKPPDQTRAGVLYPVEGDRWVVTLSGTNGDYPPGDEAGFLAFAKSLRDPAIYEAIVGAEPLSSVKLHRGTDNRWRHYEKLDRFPAGLVVLGDAVGAFNPLYGQGMTAAALAAEALSQSLDRALIPGPATERSSFDFDRLSVLFRRDLARRLQLPWFMATGEDLRWPGTIGDRPSWLVQILQAYLNRVLHLTDSNPAIHETVWKVQHMVAPPWALFQPAIVWRVVCDRLNPRAGRGQRSKPA